MGSGAFGEIYKGILSHIEVNMLIVEKKKTGEFYAAKIVRKLLMNFES